MKHEMDDADKEALQRCMVLGLHPLHYTENGLGENHHTDVPPAVVDVAVGDSIAWFLGDLFLHRKSISPRDQWITVAKALRLHGLRIANQNERESAQAERT